MGCSFTFCLARRYARDPPAKIQALRLGASSDWGACCYCVRDGRFGFRNNLKDRIESRDFENATGELADIHQLKANAFCIAQTAQLKHQPEAVCIDRRDATKIKYDCFCI